MADQIILEFIGDPSGLKPAEEALKGLSKTTHDTIEAFNKANEAAKKFAEGNKEAAKSVKEVGEASDKTVKAISTLTQVIGGGAVKVISADFKAWAKEVTDLTNEKTKLQTKLTAVEAEMKKVQSEVKTASQEYNTLVGSARSLDGQLAKNSASLAYHTTQADQAAAKSKTLKSEFDETQKKLAAMNGTSEEGSAKYNKLASAAEHLKASIDKSDKSFKDHSDRVTELGTEHQTLEGKLSSVRTEMDKVGSAVDKGKENLSGLGKESKTLESGIDDANKAIAESSQKFAGSSKAAKESTMSINSLIGHTKTLVSSMGEMSAAVADATGNERDANAIRKKTAEVLSVISTAQGIATAATEAMTAATEIATGAAVGLDVALWPVSLVLLAIAAAVAEVYAGFKIFQYIVDTVKPVRDIIESISKKLEVVKDGLRDYLSLFTNGLIESAALHKFNEEVKKTGALHEQSSVALQKQIDLLEAEGASTERIASMKKQQLAEEKLALEAKLQLETDIEKRKQLQNDLDRNAVNLIKAQKDLDEGHLDTMRAQGATELQIAIEKKKQNDYAIQANKDALLLLKTTAEIDTLHGNITDSMQRYLQLKQEEAVLEEQSKQLTKNIATEQGKALEESLQKKKAAADQELSFTIEGSKAQSEAKIKVLEAEADIERLHAGKNLTLIAEINTKLARDKAAVNNEYRIKDLQDEKTAIDTQVILAEKGSVEQFEFKMKSLDKEREIVNANIALSENQRKLALAEIGNREKELLDEQIRLVRDADKKELDENIKTNQEKLKSDKLTAEEKLIIQKQILANEMQMKIDAIVNSGKTEKEQSDLITDTISKYKTDVNNADRDKAIADVLKTGNDEIESINKTMEAMKAKGAFAGQIARKGLEIIGIQKKQNEDLHKAGLISDADYEKKKTDLTKDGEAKRKEIVKDGLEEAKKYVGKATAEIQKISDAAFDNAKQKRDNELKEKLDSMEEAKSAELLNTTLTTSQKAAIEKKYKIQEAQEKEKAWKADQKAKGEQAIINGLLAFTAALASSPPPMNYINAAIALASAGVQAGIIFTKTPPKFATGVIGLQGPGTETSDSIPAYLSKGESVITAKATKKYAPMLEAMNAGTFQDFMPIPHIPDVSSQLAAALKPAKQETTQPIDYDKLSEAFARRINMKQLHVNIDEKGFTKSILSKNSRIESYNDKMKF